MPAQGDRILRGPVSLRVDNMRESDILRLIAARVAAAGDDAAIVPFRGTNLLLTTDMLHRESDFPAGTTAHTIGWRSVAVSLSDLGAMGARPLAVLLVLADADLDEDKVSGILDGALACCEQAGAQLVGGDTDRQQELTLVSTAVGEAEHPVCRDGAKIGDLICVTGELGRTAAGLSLFSAGEMEAANELFCFPPRVAWGMKLADLATSMIDISDGLAHSLHLLAAQSGVGFHVDWERLPVTPVLPEQASGETLRDAVLYTGEDYELLFTAPADLIGQIDPTVRFTVIGKVCKQGTLIEGTLLDDNELPDRGYEH
ncbi:MAG: thiamine-phosphate kinase [Candidatus Bipolaricaulota bacterium]|nr:thiamine-phosphate kinase [Candidatus Bipolaricaulota bacterium]